MKYILLITFVMVVSCNVSNSNSQSTNIGAEVDQENALTKLYSNKNLKTRKDSLKEIYTYNEDIQKKLNQFYQSSSYMPSNDYNHVKHIRKYSPIVEPYSGTEDQIYFVDHVIQNYLEHTDHESYITDRKLLRKLNNSICESNYVSIIDTLKGGQKISITLTSKKFNSSNHALHIDDQSKFLIKIDEKYPFGAVYTTNPDEEITELDKLEIVIDGYNIETKFKEYQNLFDPQFCSFGRHKRITEAYEDGENLYIYLFGGINADTYFAKLIFNVHNGYIGKIVTDYVPLSSYGSFSDQFIGY